MDVVSKDNTYKTEILQIEHTRWMFFGSRKVALHPPPAQCACGDNWKKNEETILKYMCTIRIISKGLSMYYIPHLDSARNISLLF